MINSSKVRILKTIQNGLGKDNADLSAGLNNLTDMPENSFLTETVVQDSELLIRRFSEELSRVDGLCHIAESRDEVEYRLLEILYGYSVESFCISPDPLVDGLGVESMLEGRGVKRLNPADADEISRADAGITGAQYGISDTGTLVVLSDDKCSRSVSLLPPVHISFIDKAFLLKDIHQLFYRLKHLDRDVLRSSSCMTFITGPSRTADIELNLTLGVHGPGKLIVFIVK